MLIDIISKAYEGRIKLQAPLVLDNVELPDELKTILIKANGIMETMIVPQKEQPIEIGWIIFPYDQICKETELYKNEYGIDGIVFATDGAGNPYYLLDGKVYEYNPIDDESELIADSLSIFYGKR